MERTIVKIKTYPDQCEAWYQRRWLWMWWTVSFKVGWYGEVIDWAVDKNVYIIVEQ